LVATDVAARGIDVDNLAFVVHYQLPDQIEYYTHRSGRTARAGKTGISLVLVNQKELKRIWELEKELKIKFLKIK
jgi:ATP-dependent RNA helicase DeaD